MNRKEIDHEYLRRAAALLDVHLYNINAADANQDFPAVGHYGDRFIALYQYFSRLTVKAMNDQAEARELVEVLGELYGEALHDSVKMFFKTLIEVLMVKHDYEIEASVSMPLIPREVDQYLKKMEDAKELEKALGTREMVKKKILSRKLSPKAIRELDEVEEKLQSCGRELSELHKKLESGTITRSKATTVINELEERIRKLKQKKMKLEEGKKREQNPMWG